MQWGLLPDNQATHDGKVVGVVKDFHFASLRDPIEPLVVTYQPKGLGYLSLKLQGNNMDALSQIRNAWTELDPDHPFDYFFLDDQFDQQYNSIEKRFTIFSYFAILSILIACLGLFALTSYTTEQRTKEIGIRKVLGASVRNITMLIAKEYLILVMIAFVLACLLGYYLMYQFLQEYHYRIDIGIMNFLISGLLAFTIAIIAVSINTLTAGVQDPVKSLKYE